MPFFSLSLLISEVLLLGQEDMIVRRDHILFMCDDHHGRLLFKSPVVIDGFTVLHFDPHLLVPRFVEIRWHKYPSPSRLHTIAIPLCDLDAQIPRFDLDVYPVAKPSELAISSLPQ